MKSNLQSILLLILCATLIASCNAGNSNPSATTTLNKAITPNSLAANLKISDTLSLSESTITDYRNSLQMIPLGAFGIINIVLKNTSNQAVNQIKPLILGGTDEISFDMYRTTCAIDSPQSLLAGESCAYAIKYLPHITESGTIDLSVTALDANNQLVENTMIINYSSYIKKLTPGSLNLNKATKTSYRNTLQVIPIGTFGLMNIIIANNSPQNLINIEPFLSMSNSRMSIDKIRTTCATTGLQNLSIGESCSYVIRYTPATPESGHIQMNVMAIDETNNLIESSMILDYSSY